MLIYVSHDNISHGVKMDCFDCPVAKALQRVFNNIPLSVYNDIINMYIAGRWISYKTPYKAKRFMCKFDTRQTVEPFIFVFDFKEIK